MRILWFVFTMLALLGFMFGSDDPSRGFKNMVIGVIFAIITLVFLF